MKFTFDKQWLQKHAETDQDLEIAAGSFSLDQLPPAPREPADPPPVEAGKRAASKRH
jgi:hypothetical protein